MAATHTFLAGSVYTRGSQGCWECLWRDALLIETCWWQLTRPLWARQGSNSSGNKRQQLITSVFAICLNCPDACWAFECSTIALSSYQPLLVAHRFTSVDKPTNASIISRFPFVKNKGPKLWYLVRLFSPFPFHLPPLEGYMLSFVAFFFCVDKRGKVWKSQQMHPGPFHEAISQPS